MVAPRARRGRLFAPLAAGGLLLAASVALAASGEVSADGLGATRTAACEQARVSAKGAAVLAAMSRGISGSVYIAHYAPCTCVENPPPAGAGIRWSCSVIARYATDGD